MEATVELKELVLPLELGTYGPGDVVPDAHYLDMTLIIDPAKVLVERDSMDAVFDYDPLIAQIEALARDGHYETQEWLMARIAKSCASYTEIKGVELMVYKGPVLAGSGKLGVRLKLDRPALDQICGSA